MTVGTKSVLFGAHQFAIHPWFVAAAWWKLYGFPWDLRLWIAFFVHDLGYVGKPNIDGPEGERHVEFGATVMRRLFGQAWGDLCLFHSRYYAKKHGQSFSRLCVADKLSIAMTPAWLYLPAVTLTGEIREYLKNAQRSESTHWKPTGFDGRVWYSQLRRYMREWVEAHKDGAKDTWTSENRHAKTASGVWQ